jgi:hypothetical protein
MPNAKQPAAEEPIDWDNVNQEAASMIALNPQNKPPQEDAPEELQDLLGWLTQRFEEEAAAGGSTSEGGDPSPSPERRTAD